MADRETCRRAAAECVQLAAMTGDPAKKEVLLLRAQEWIRLAYARSDEEFERLVGELNVDQMTPVQRQRMQQQQQMSKKD